MSIRCHIVLMVSLWAGATTAAPLDYALPDAYSELRSSAGQEAGRTAAQGNCLTCHSTDYIAMQPPGKGKAFWDAEVTKMIKVYHAPIDEADGKAIAAYLADAY
ncbi:cytochrome c [Methylobacterium sp. WL103]|uniref:SorB family sulfite dehydrogenase c-type cytochrome subunit n=1 Tax=unclassified Methylobacterium TaxID=2615210 RepID=UPI0011CCD32B|nr:MULTISPECIES: cytochrome c [unclassified Methylobacterium]TXN08129.1 cytochrome c [Methylobacterium sp. WL122]TXM67108.1 cytochrome c [Methylobacterium sp. WL12]TXM69257.1 cytochrome c [Methylobacterium sp. WL120]TXN00462.1 cytochrome c [Methylobacterium sp. WL103]TXN80502.1 cytochrome c [Methylobacterium sp. WL8]